MYVPDMQASEQGKAPSDPTQASKLQRFNKLLLQLHAHAICIQKPLPVPIKVTARPAEQMQALLRLLLWTSTSD